jgi:hypothetical protein
MPASLQTLALDLTDIYASPRAVVLLDGLISTKPFTVDIGANDTHLIFADPHKLVTDSRFRLNFSAGGALPACATPLLTTQDYFAIKIDDNIIQLKINIGDLPLTLLSNGVGTLTMTEQVLQPSDSIAVIVNHEVRHPNEIRFSFDPPDSQPRPATDDARTPTQIFNIPISDLNPAYSYQGIALIRAGSLTVGNTDGDGDRTELVSLPVRVNIAPGGSGDLSITGFLLNA